MEISCLTYVQSVSYTHLDVYKRQSIFRAFQPEIVIHLAARTDLRGVTLQDYDANMSGVLSLIHI